MLVFIGQITEVKVFRIIVGFMEIFSVFVLESILKILLSFRFFF